MMVAYEIAKMYLTQRRHAPALTLLMPLRLTFDPALSYRFVFAHRVMFTTL